MSILIRSASKAFLMSTHNIYFHGEIRKIFYLDTTLNWSYAILLWKYYIIRSTRRGKELAREVFCDVFVCRKWLS